MCLQFPHFCHLDDEIHVMSTFMAIECISWFDIVVRLFYFIICVTEEWNGNCIYMTAWTLSSFCRSTWTKKCIKRSWMCMMELKRISTVKNCNKSGIGRMPEFRTLNLKITGKQLVVNVSERGLSLYVLGGLIHTQTYNLQGICHKAKHCTRWQVISGLVLS